MELSYFIYKYINSTRIWSTSFLISGSLISLSFFIKNEVNLGNGFNIFRFCLSFLVLYFLNNISNLVNTYYDFINGLDKKETSADRTLFQNSIKITLNDIEFFIKITYLGVLISLITLLVNCNLQFNETIYHVLPITITISFISHFYTAPPISFKYRALGEISASFNLFSIVPFPIYFQNIQLFKDYFNEIFNYSMILTISCCTIIFSNNIRDLKNDKISNIITIPIIIGENLSYSIYFSIYFLIYFYLFILSIIYNNIYLNLPTIITITSLYNIFKDTKNGNYKHWDLKTAKLSFILCVSLSIGIFCK
ncbi:UbiA prenyltransferase family protein [Dictyostelium discoideum AX4]|uniref:UbiA prenyltransferase family protein n=1 Tax=Dictyostelium discoideum TaxID=44689 RepID=C7G049_DICDI|nr:UbiA prenyltransferase family protein [Dictyostelium discoideum AX4]EEU04071.1 UbiA prenyltransferase family protein [Dictyostelium discoideum AX4]|eukprot:XP_002649123.1 UbiA prenyltransferase family protein [Dictyostelium discoideum AX4]